MGLTGNEARNYIALRRSSSLVDAAITNRDESAKISHEEQLFAPSPPDSLPCQSLRNALTLKPLETLGEKLTIGTLH
jgi:hypothetical protein